MNGPQQIVIDDPKKELKLVRELAVIVVKNGPFKGRKYVRNPRTGGLVRIDNR